MKLFDLHCDTLYRAVDENKNLYDNDLHVSVSKIKRFDSYVGCFAAWVSDEYKGENAFEMFKKMYNKLRDSVGENFQIFTDAEKLKRGNRGVIFTVENGAVLGGKISNIQYLYDCGVRVLTLTWNGKNEIGDGIGVDKPGGITEFGRRSIKIMEEKGIIVDLSHASERLFYDVASISRKPFIATHSNAQKICSHKRNLTDEQINIIKSVNGIIGLNFCDYFLKNDGNASMDDVIRHIDYFLSMGCEDTLCIGSDFDGSDVLKDITGIENIEILYEYCLKHNYSENLVNKIFYGNANNFFMKVL